MWSPIIEVLDELAPGETMTGVQIARRLTAEQIVPRQVESYEAVGCVQREPGIHPPRFSLTERGRQHAMRMYESTGMDRETWISLKGAVV